MTTASERLDRVPPCLCRLLALTGSSHRRRPMTNKEIARRACLSQSTIEHISRMLTWKRVPVGTLDRFAYGCGVNPLYTRDVRRRLRDSKKVFMRNATPRQRQMLDRLMKALIGSHRNYAAVDTVPTTG